VEKPALVSYISWRADEFNAARIERRETSASTARSNDYGQRRIKKDHVGPRVAWQCNAGRQTLKGERKGEEAELGSRGKAK
jgi:hypothetical protein